MLAPGDKGHLIMIQPHYDFISIMIPYNYTLAELDLFMLLPHLSVDLFEAVGAFPGL